MMSSARDRLHSLVSEKIGVLSEGFGSSLNIARVSLKEARAYAEKEFEATGKKLDDILPDFDSGYLMMQRALKSAPDIKRIDMPVIEPSDMAQFDSDLKKGHIDIFKPYAKGQFVAPKNLNKETGKEWIFLGTKDGSPTDDPIQGRWTSIAAGKLRPIQKEIWLEKVIGNIIKHGKPGAGSNVLNTTVIVSKEGYILDGHHRYGQVMLVDPGLKLSALFIPLPINTLLEIGRSYGNAIGNTQKA